MNYVVGLLCLLSAFSVDAQQPLRGYVQTPAGEAVAYVNIVNTSRQVFTLSQPSGYFTIDAVEQDTLRFSIMGYRPYRMVVTAEHFTQEVRVVVTEDSILLPGITIYDRPMEPVMKAPDRSPMTLPGVRGKEGIEPRKPITFDPGNAGNTAGGVPTIGVGGTFTGVLTYLYDQFSKEGRERRKYEESRQQSMQEAEYTALMTDPETAATLQKQYHLTPSEYDRLIIAFNQQYPEAKKLPRKNEILGLLHHFFSQYVPGDVE